MKFFTFLLFLTLSTATANSLAQVQLSLEMKNADLKEVFAEITRLTEYKFVFSNNEIESAGKITIHAENEDLKMVLERCLANTKLGFRIENQLVLISPKLFADEKKNTAIAKGTVTDKNKQPIPGATVLLKGTTIGSATDVKGKFSILISDTTKAELVFTFIGMKTIIVKYQDRPKQGDWIIELEEDLVTMDEVTVVSTGYGDIDRRRLTSAVTSLKMDDIMVPGLNSVDQMLEGRIPGMIFMQNSGQVGATPRVRIRGNSTIIGNQEPLWVVDGIVQHDPVNIDPAQLNDLDFVNLLGNAISGLNPEDIERIDVLKDAAATAIYGTRAANGVIVISTKKGKAGPPSVSYSLSGTFSRRPYYTDDNIYMMNSKQRVEVSRELFERQIGYENVTEFVGYEKALLDLNAGRIDDEEFQKLTAYYETMNTDWFDVLCQNSFSNKHTLSLSGGSENIRYYASIGYNSQQGVIRKEEQKQLTSALKLNGSFDKMQFQFSMNFNNSKSKYTPNVNGISVIQYAHETNRALPAYNPDGTRSFYQKGEYGGNKTLMFNMEHEMEKTYQRIKGNSLTMTGDVKYWLLKMLNVEGTVSYSTSNSNQENIYEEDSYYVNALRGTLDYSNMCPVGGEWNNSNTRQDSWVARLQLNYGQEFGTYNQHYVSASLGGELSAKEYITTAETQRGYYPDRGKVFGNISTKDQSKYPNYVKWLVENKPTINETLTNLGSAYLTATYSYDNRYTINFNTRLDISNQFGSRSREKLLPIWSISGRWDIARDFWKDSANVNELALKLSYGHQGNMIDGQTSKMIINKGVRDDFFGEFSSTVNMYPNPDLKWETTASYNAEITFSLLRNKISGSVGYYYKKTTDAFLNKKISMINGRENYTVNKGSLENQGVEVTLSFTPINQQLTADGKRGFVWRFDPQIGQVVNKLVSKAINNKNNILRDEVEYTDFLNGTVEMAGEPLNTFYSYRFKGLTHEEGKPIFYGAEPDAYDELHPIYNKMTNEEIILKVMEPSGTRVPVLQGGFSNYIGYRQFSLSFNLAYSLGNKIRLLKLCEDYNIRPYPAVNLRREFTDRWRKPGDEAKTNIPGLVAKEQPRDVWWRGGWKYKFAPNSYYEMYDYSDIRVISGDYLKLQSASLRYMMDDAFCKKIGINSAYITVSGTNLFIIANKKAKGMDVTSQSGSARTINLSVRPTYSLSLNVTF